MMSWSDLVGQKSALPEIIFNCRDALFVPFIYIVFKLEKKIKRNIAANLFIFLKQYCHQVYLVLPLLDVKKMLGAFQRLLIKVLSSNSIRTGTRKEEKSKCSVGFERGKKCFVCVFPELFC